MTINPEELEKKKAEIQAAEEKLKKEKEEEEQKKKEAEEEAEKAKAKEEEEKIKSIVGNSEAVAALLEAKRKANAEAKSQRLELEEMKKKIKEAEDKELEKKGEFEKIAAKSKVELEETTKKFKTKLIADAVKIEAIKQGAIDPEISKLIDTSEIKVDNDFNVTGAEDAVKAYKKLKPEFFGEESREPEGSKKPGLREKILGKGQEGKKSPRQLIVSGLGKSKKK